MEKILSESDFYSYYNPDHFKERKMSKLIKVLVVEDDDDINNMICDLLRQNGYIPIPSFSGTEATMCFKNDSPCLVLLDLMLPGRSGELVLSDIREISQVPVIVITAIASKESIVSILKLGANDYIAKPFDNDELLARMEVQLRQQSDTVKKDVTNKEILIYKELVLNTDQYDVLICNQSIILTKIEYEILKLLVTNPKKVFTKNNLYESIWNDDFIGDDNTINVHISNIRSKISKLRPLEKYIHTVWGVGYKMHE